MGFLNKCLGGCGSTSKKQPSATIEDLCHRFSLSQLRKSTNNFDNSRIIRRYAWSVVYRASISINGQLKDLAVERFEQPVGVPRISWCKKNIIYRCLVRHPNLVSLVGFCDDGNEMIVANDYAPNGSLGYQLWGTERNSPTLSWKRRLEISIGVARGLHYLHSGTKRTIIHRDIRSSTILLYENWVPKLKFSWISVKGPKFSDRKARPIEVEVAGTSGYIAPEHLIKPEVTHKCDVYSFGAVLIELICGQCLFDVLRQHGDIEELGNLAETGNAKEFVDERLLGEIAAECFKLYMEIAESCRSEDLNERPDMGEVEVQLEHVLQLQEEADTNRASQASLSTGKHG